jgi:hypothetical protein
LFQLFVINFRLGVWQLVTDHQRHLRDTVKYNMLQNIILKQITCVTLNGENSFLNRSRLPHYRGLSVPQSAKDNDHPRRVKLSSSMETPVFLPG